jgi:sulfoxide reductase heme-binding subunit YedZ
MSGLAWPVKAYPLVAGILSLSALVIVLRYQGIDFTWEANQSLIQDTGVLALGLFCLSLLSTPLRNLARRCGYEVGNVHKQRRLLGLSATAAALCHVTLIYQLHVGDAPLLGAWYQPYAQAGAAALLILLLLAITSFPKPTRFLQIRHWKTLHRLVHFTFFLLLLHMLLGPHSQPSYTLSLFAVVASISWLGRLNP